MPPSPDAPAASGALLPFVGRAAELRSAERALRDGRDVLIDGAPGSGRSRLLAELRAALHGSPAVTVLDDADALTLEHSAPHLANTTTPIAAVAAAEGAFAAALRRRGEPEVLVLAPLDAAALTELLGDPAIAGLFDPSALESVRARSRALSPHEAEEHADRLWQHALASGRPHELASAALALQPRFGYVGERIAELGRRAAAALAAGDHPPEQEARLRARIALTGLTDGISPREQAERAVALVRHDGDSTATAEALLAYAATDLGPDSLHERIAMARRVLAIAAETAQGELAAVASFVLIGSLVESGDIAAVDAELAQRSRESGGGPRRHLAWFRAMRAILDGRIDEAEARCAEAMEIGLAEQDADAESVYFGQLGIVRWLQGREQEVEPLYLAAREQQPEAPVWRAVLARLWALSGRKELAAAVLGEPAEVQRIPRDRNWMLTLCVLAEAAVIVGDAGAAHTLRAELLPYSGRLVTVGLGVGCYGGVDRPLGLLAGQLGLLDEAEHHFRAAIAFTSAVGARPWLAQAQADLAALLRERGTPDAELETEAAANARLAGVEHLLRPDAPDGRPAIRVLGTFEVIDATGQRAAWTSRKARELLKILIARGGTVARSTLLGLLWPDERPELAANRLSVALSTVRRTLDPLRVLPSAHFVGGDGESIWLQAERLSIDLRELLHTAERALGSVPADREALQRVIGAYRGPAFADELDAEWATGPRQDAATAFLRAGRALGEAALDDEPLLAADVYHRILAEDPYDEAGHLGLMSALDRLGAHGRSEQARHDYYARMADLGITVEQLRGT